LSFSVVPIHRDDEEQQVDISKQYSIIKVQTNSNFWLKAIILGLGLSNLLL
jgi:hypothetical protein